VSKLCAWLGFPARGANITGRLRWVGTELRKSSFRSPATVPQSREHPWAWRLNRYWRAGHGCMWGVSRCSARGVLHVCWGAEMRTKRATSSGAKLNRTTTRIAEFDLESSPTQFRAQRDAKYEVFLAVRVENTYKCRCCGEMEGCSTTQPTEPCFRALRRTFLQPEPSHRVPGLQSKYGSHVAAYPKFIPSMPRLVSRHSLSRIRYCSIEDPSASSASNIKFCQ
jgi:hypothetical protein